MTKHQLCIQWPAQLCHMPGMLSRAKETSELKVSVGPYLRNVISLCLNELVHHPSVKVFSTKLFNRALIIFLKFSMGESVQ